MLLLLIGCIGDGVYGSAQFSGGSLEASEDGQDLIQGLLGVSREVTNLIRHHGKASPMFTGSSRLDGRIQGQQIGLVGDVTDHIDDGGGAGHRLVQQTQ